MDTYHNWLMNFSHKEGYIGSIPIVSTMNFDTFSLTILIVGRVHLVRKVKDITGTIASKEFGVTKDHNVELTRSEAIMEREFDWEVINQTPSHSTLKEVFGKGNKKELVQKWQGSDPGTKMNCFAKDFISAVDGAFDFEINI